tara:strand:- start:716 stop:1972 length:1257 start_codon:yes stop_codon:yes gene_type:complete
MTHIYVEHEFKPVGQGLFAFGAIEFRRVQKGRRMVYTRQSPDWDFTWVYDCGTSSGQALVDKGIREIAKKLHNKLDLVFISHLHMDHISGLLRLLEEVGAINIVFPWAPLWQRLLIGFEQGLSDGDREMGFYVDPVAFLVAEAPERFERITFVRPSNGGGPPDPNETQPGIDPDDLGPREESKFATAGAIERLEVPDNWENRQIAVELPAGSRFVRGGAWEFVPYNDPDSAPKSADAFKDNVKILSQALLETHKTARSTALTSLKKLYLKNFAAGMQNNLSLNLYTGPVPLRGYIPEPLANPDTGEIVVPINRAPVLYTGDANYSTKIRFDRMTKYFGDKRVKAVATFQVPHHGSKHNWKKGLAPLISPESSVFSSNPTGDYFHPDAEIWREFSPHGPVQVDKHTGFSWKAHFTLPGK